jgi:hypothetical protein
LPKTQLKFNKYLVNNPKK